jgi:hypothetical protein
VCILMYLRGPLRNGLAGVNKPGGSFCHLGLLANISLQPYITYAKSARAVVAGMASKLVVWLTYLQPTGLLLTPQLR